MHTIHDNTVSAFDTIVEVVDENGVIECRNGRMREQWMVAVQSENPRVRHLFRPNYNLAFQLQEGIAYWRGLNPGHVERYNTQMERYMVDGKLNGSAYGDRLRHAAHDQIDRVVRQLRERENTRRAVAIIHQPGRENYFDGIDVACTLSLQFVVRDGALHLTSNMRSQDLLYGYPYDVANFQWLQEVVAGLVDAELGTFTHVMNSCHLYEGEREAVERAVGSVEPAETPDCRLPADRLEEVVATLSDVLAAARDGEDPAVPDRMPAFYRDWAHLVVGYEHHRFHGNPRTAADHCERIQQAQWRDWLGRRL